MLRKDQRRFSFTDWQILQLKQSIRRLHKLNRDAFGELRRVGRMLATRMISALRLRQEILTAGREQQPVRIEVIVGLACEPCAADRQFTEPDDESVSREALKEDPARQTEIETLLDLAQRTEERLSARCKSRRIPPAAFFRGIGRLTLALLRQQRHLRDTAPRQTTEIKVQSGNADGPDICMYCHKSMEIDSPAEGPDRQVDQGSTREDCTA
jgi:hypothetical protein